MIHLAKGAAMEYRTHSPAETRALGAALARRLTPGAVVGLNGPLGAGKTAFVQGMAEALGVEEPVVSPTFAILCVYEGAVQLVHMDAYRLEDADDLESTGFYDFLDGRSILAIEWSDHIAPLLPEGIIRVAMAPLGETNRIIHIEGVDKLC
jgi:tRNA threonylcarbamoyladenosine biosynthesis protein TsaE